jgi:hypothetical protein
LEPEVDFVAPAEEESSTITQVAAENLSPKIESEGPISQTPVETIPIPEDATTSVANVEDQIIAPVDVRSEHAAVIEPSSTDEPTEVILPPNVEESPETLTPLVEPSYKSSDDEIVKVSVFPILMHNAKAEINNLKGHVVPVEDVHVPETQVLDEAALVSIMAAGALESGLGRGVAENMSVPLQELPVNPELEEPATHEEAVTVSSSSLEIPEVDVPVTVETEAEPLSTNFTSEDKVSTQEHVLSLENPDAANAELNNDSVPLAAAESGPEVVDAAVAPVSVLGTSESQEQHSAEESTEVSFINIPSARSHVDCNKIIKEVHIVEAASEAGSIVPNEGRS